MKPKTKFENVKKNVIARLIELKDGFDGGMNYDLEDGYCIAIEDVLTFIQSLTLEDVDAMAKGPTSQTK